MLVDPTGRDIWSINEYGEVVKVDENKEFDRFEIVDNKGNIITKDGKEQILQFDYGTVERVFNKHVYSFGGDDYIFTSFLIKGDDNAKNMFEFMANPGVTTNVEWSRTKVGYINRELNFIGTSHETEYTIDGARLLLEGYTIWDHVHNHPKNYPPSANDVTIRNAILKNFPKATDRLYRNGVYENIPGVFKKRKK